MVLAIDTSGCNCAFICRLHVPLFGVETIFVLAVDIRAHPTPSICPLNSQQIVVDAALTRSAIFLSMKNHCLSNSFASSLPKRFEITSIWTSTTARNTIGRLKAGSISDQELYNSDPNLEKYYELTSSLTDQLEPEIIILYGVTVHLWLLKEYKERLAATGSRWQ